MRQWYGTWLSSSIQYFIVHIPKYMLSGQVKEAYMYVI